MSVGLQHNIGAFLKAIPAVAPGSVVSKSSDSAAEVVGRIIDRFAVPGSTGRAYQSVKFVVPFNGTWQTSLGVRVTGRLLHATSTAAADFTAFGSTSVVRTFATTTTATSTSGVGVAEFDYDLRMARRYLQFNVAVDLIASSSGSVAYHAVGVFGGADELPTGILGNATTSAVATVPISTTS